jgi:hypothetical protein
MVLRVCSELRENSQEKTLGNLKNMILILDFLHTAFDQNWPVW